MRIRRLLIRNFRGIRSLDWNLPDHTRLYTLIGPGDGGKSTVLNAIDYLLGDRWNIPFTDTDFFFANTDEEICIRAYITGIPRELLRDSALGLYLCGTNENHAFSPDPSEGFDPSLEVQLKVDASLEPEWSVIKNGEQHRLTSSQRRKFGVFSVDSRSEAQLRWSRTSALGRMSAETGADRKVLAQANRAAQEAISSGRNSELMKLTSQIQNEINAIGGGHFQNLGAGLDTYRNSMGASLALYEEGLPLTSYGTGTKRLASLAVQQLHAGERSLALLDEIEMGLEPHRAVGLINTLRQDERYAQVFITTHSPVVVEQVEIDSLTVVRNQNGEVSITTIGESSDRFAKIRRGRPSSLLARRILVCEGKTEYGIIKSLLESWDRERFDKRQPTSTSIGFTLSDAEGGSEVALRAIELKNLGYEVAGLMDNDETDTSKAVEKAQGAKIPIFRWENSHNTETQICQNLDYSQLQEFATLHATKQRHRNKALKDLQRIAGETCIGSLSADEWERNQLDIGILQAGIGKAAHENGWYKDITKGEILGQWLLKNQEEPNLKQVWSVLRDLETFIYG